MIPLLLTIMVLADPTAAALPSNGKWIVDYEPEMCVASHAFGDGSTVLAIKPSIDMTSIASTYYLIAPVQGSKAVSRGRATITLQPSGAVLSVDYAAAPIKTGQRGFEFFTDEAMVKGIEQSTAITFAADGQQFRLAPGQMQKMRAALTACSENLLRHWGVDPAARAIPAGTVVSWFSADKYPSEALRASQQGRVVAVVTVAPSGRPSACRVVISSKSPSLDSTTCRVAMRTGRFEKSPDGKDRYTVLAVRWSIPN